MKRNSVTDRNGSFRKVFHIAPSYGNFAQSGVTVRYAVTPDFFIPTTTGEHDVQNKEPD
jgi:hypothetical protein